MWPLWAGAPWAAAVPSAIMCSRAPWQHLLECGVGMAPTQLRPPHYQGACPHRSPQQNLLGRGVGPLARAITAWPIDGAIAGGTWGMAWGHPSAGHSPGVAWDRWHLVAKPERLWETKAAIFCVCVHVPISVCAHVPISVCAHFCVCHAPMISVGFCLWSSYAPPRVVVWGEMGSRPGREVSWPHTAPGSFHFKCRYCSLGGRGFPWRLRKRGEGRG